MQKTTFPAVVATFVVSFAFWVLLTWSFTVQELIVGAVVSLGVALFSARFFIHEKAFWLFNPAKLLNGLFYWLCIFPVELVKANVDMAKRCFGGCKKINPGIVKVPVDLKSDYGQAALANSITLTPGTITMDITEEEHRPQRKRGGPGHQGHPGKRLKEGLGMSDLLIFAIAFAILAALTLIRLAKGPTAADRMVAGDSADILICVALVLFSLFSGRGIYLDIALVAALFGVIDTMLVGRYLEKERGQDK